MKKIAKIGLWLVLLEFALIACATANINTPFPENYIERIIPQTQPFQPISLIIPVSGKVAMIMEEM